MRRRVERGVDRVASGVQSTPRQVWCTRGTRRRAHGWRACHVPLCDDSPCVILVFGLRREGAGGDGGGRGVGGGGSRRRRRRRCQAAAIDSLLSGTAPPR